MMSGMRRLGTIRSHLTTPAEQPVSGTAAEAVADAWADADGAIAYLQRSHGAHYSTAAVSYAHSVCSFVRAACGHGAPVSERTRRNRRSTQSYVQTSAPGPSGIRPSRPVHGARLLRCSISARG